MSFCIYGLPRCWLGCGWLPQAQDQFVIIGHRGASPGDLLSGRRRPFAGCMEPNPQRKHGFRCSQFRIHSGLSLQPERHWGTAGELHLRLLPQDRLLFVLCGQRASRISKDSGPQVKPSAVLFSLHPEPFTLVWRVPMRAWSFADLCGKARHVGRSRFGHSRPPSTSFLESMDIEVAKDFRLGVGIAS